MTAVVTDSNGNKHRRQVITATSSNMNGNGLQQTLTAITCNGNDDRQQRKQVAMSANMTGVDVDSNGSEM